MLNSNPLYAGKYFHPLTFKSKMAAMRSKITVFAQNMKSNWHITLILVSNIKFSGSRNAIVLQNQQYCEQLSLKSKMAAMSSEITVFGHRIKTNWYRTLILVSTIRFSMSRNPIMLQNLQYHHFLTFKSKMAAMRHTISDCFCT